MQDKSNVSGHIVLSRSDEKRIASIKNRIEKYLGTPVTDEFFDKCVTAYFKGKPCHLGHWAFLGYGSAFEEVLGHSPGSHDAWPCRIALGLANCFFISSVSGKDKGVTNLLLRWRACR